jgi:hypothetical protein
MCSLEWSFAVIESIISVLMAFPTYKDDREDPRKRDQLVMVAEAVDYASRVEGWQGRQSELAALLITVGWHESSFALHIHAGKCKPWECDRGRARGPWQVHKNRLNTDSWDSLLGLEPASTRLAAIVAAQALVRARAQCRSLAGSDWVNFTLTAYAGRGCVQRWDGVRPRFNTYRKVLSRLDAPPKRARADAGIASS